MALLRSSLADKNIVDRTKAPRNREVAHAVRRTRDRLSQTQGNPVFDRELLKLHARAIINSDVSKNGAMIAGYHQTFLSALQASTQGRDVEWHS